MDSIQLVKMRIKAFDLINRSNAPEKELKAFMSALFTTLLKEHVRQRRTNDLLEGIVENISISEIANEG